MFRTVITNKNKKNISYLICTKDLVSPYTIFILEKGEHNIIEFNNVLDIVFEDISYRPLLKTNLFQKSNIEILNLKSNILNAKVLHNKIIYFSIFILDNLIIKLYGTIKTKLLSKEYFYKQKYKITDNTFKTAEFFHENKEKISYFFNQLLLLKIHLNFYDYINKNNIIFNVNEFKYLKTIIENYDIDDLLKNYKNVCIFALSKFNSNESFKLEVIRKFHSLKNIINITKKYKDKVPNYDVKFKEFNKINTRYNPNIEKIKFGLYGNGIHFQDKENLKIFLYERFYDSILNFKQDFYYHKQYKLSDLLNTAYFQNNKLKIKKDADIILIKNIINKDDKKYNIYINNKKTFNFNQYGYFKQYLSISYEYNNFIYRIYERNRNKIFTNLNDAIDINIDKLNLTFEKISNLKFEKFYIFDTKEKLMKSICDKNSINIRYEKNIINWFDNYLHNIQIIDSSHFEAIKTIIKNFQMQVRISLIKHENLYNDLLIRRKIFKLLISKDMLRKDYDNYEFQLIGCFLANKKYSKNELDELTFSIKMEILEKM